MDQVMTEYIKRQSEFYEAVGRALSRWQAIEVMLSLLFALIMQSRRPLLPMKTFHSVTSFSVRLKMLQVAAEDSLSSEQLQKLKPLLKRVAKASFNRNKLAHFMYNAVVAESGKTDIYLAHIYPEPTSLRSIKVRIDQIHTWESEWNQLLLELAECQVTMVPSATDR